MIPFKKRWRWLTTTIVGMAAVVALLAGCSSQGANQSPVTATMAGSASSGTPTTMAGSGALPAATSTAGPPTPTVLPTPATTATPALTATTVPPSLTAIATALAVGSGATTSAATSSTCATVPIRGFGLVWQEHPAVQGLVGCPTAAEAATGVVSEPFEHGWMVQLSSPAPGEGSGRVVYVLFGDDATVAQVPDTWTAADAVPAGQTPPAGLVAPVRDFGKVWRDGTNLRIRERLGWAKGPEKGAAGAWQRYKYGQMIWTPDPKQIFVLGAQGRATGIPNAWQLYPDLFAG